MADQKHHNVPDAKAAEQARVAPAKPHITPAGATAQEYWAVIETNGTLVRGHNVTRSAKVGTGQYEVVFTADVSHGVYVATIGRPGIATEPAGEIGVALRCCLGGAEANKGVWIDTHDSTGAPSDRSFHVVVHV